MGKKRAESAIPPQIKIVGYPCLISPKSFSMNKKRSASSADPFWVNIAKND